MTLAPQIEALGDSALLIRFGERIDTRINAQALHAQRALREARLHGVTDVAAAFASVCIRYDPCAWQDNAGNISAFAQISAVLTEFLRNVEIAPIAAAAADFQIPVCYGGNFGPDLELLARHAGLSVAQAIECHTQASYRVAMLGFAPGFPYLLGLDPSLHAPRRASPRLRVAAGSVAIGGAQTGIYPCDLPGGWQIIGRTPLRLFDPARASPALFHAGQCVRFRAIDTATFDSWKS